MQDLVRNGILNRQYKVRVGTLNSQLGARKDIRTSWNILHTDRYNRTLGIKQQFGEHLDNLE